MKATRYYRFAFLLPVLLGALALTPLLHRYGTGVLTIIASEIFSSGKSAEYVGVTLLSFVLIPVAMAYAPVAAGALWFLRNRDEEAHRKLARRAPWFFGISTACVAIVAVFGFGLVGGDLRDLTWIPAVLAVIVGYVYLCVAAVVFLLLRAVSLIDRS